MTRTWKAKAACMMPWHDFKAGETCELDDEAVTDRVKALFVCMTPDEVQAEKEKEEAKSDPTYNVMLQRLKQANVTIPRGANKAKIRELFDATLADGTLPAMETKQ